MHMLFNCNEYISHINTISVCKEKKFSTVRKSFRKRLTELLNAVEMFFFTLSQ